MRPPQVGWLMAFVALATDQAVKAAVVSAGTPDRSVSLLPFLDFSVRYNSGISFSMFAQNTEFGRIFLLCVTAAAIVLLAVWLFRCRSSLSAAGLGAIIGGAVGNALDRLNHGAVVDFLDLHAFGQHFFVFNLADVAINLGVVLLIVDVILESRYDVKTNARRPEAR